MCEFPHTISSCIVFTSPEEDIKKVYSCSVHIVIKLLRECPNLGEKPLLENFRNFHTADHAQLDDLHEWIELKPNCHTNIKRMFEELYDFFDSLIDPNVYSVITGQCHYRPVESYSPVLLPNIESQ